MSKVDSMIALCKRGMEDDQDALDRLGLMGASFDPPRVSHTDMNTLQVRYNATLHTGLAAKKLGITFLENQCLYTMEYIRAIATATGLWLEHQIDNQDVCEVMLSLLEEKERVAMDEKSGDNSEESEDEPAGTRTPAPTRVSTAAPPPPPPAPTLVSTGTPPPPPVPTLVSTGAPPPPPPPAPTLVSTEANPPP